MKTIENRIEELKARHAAELAETEAREAICAMLPESIKLPTISNISNGQVHAWLSFSPDYGQDAKAFALSIFTELEKAGAKPLPASLCKWDNYRRSVSVGHVNDIPSEKPGYGYTARPQKLNDIDAIAPLWVTPCQYTGVEAKAFYELNGKIFKVSVKAPFPAYLSCHRSEYHGGWRFDGPCTVQFPAKWHSIHTESGESVANISQHTRGHRDTEQGISGDIYWMPLTEQDAFPLTPAQFMAELLKP
jgi:hypothetical protein